MTDDIYDPLDEYVNTFQPRFEHVAKDTFAQLAKEAQVDVMPTDRRAVCCTTQRSRSAR